MVGDMMDMSRNDEGLDLFNREDLDANEVLRLYVEAVIEERWGTAGMLYPYLPMIQDEGWMRTSNDSLLISGEINR